jgi:hypothetical protein
MSHKINKALFELGWANMGIGSETKNESAEQFIQSLIREYGKHNDSTDGGTWYPQACRSLTWNIISNTINLYPS